MIRLLHAVPHSVRQTLPPTDHRSLRFRDTLSAAQHDEAVTFVRGITAPAMTFAQARALLGLEPELAPDCVTLWREADGADLDEAALNQWDGDDDVVPAA